MMHISQQECLGIPKVSYNNTGGFEMKVILLEDVKSLGKKGQLVEVNAGYARNFILPKKLGVEA